jgi:hypothetical protein
MGIIERILIVAAGVRLAKEFEKKRPEEDNSAAAICARFFGIVIAVVIVIATLNHLSSLIQ